MLKIIRRVFSIALIILGMGILVWALIPVRRHTVSEYLEPTAMQLPSIDSSSVSALMEVRQVQLQWPVSLRIGDPATITLVFQPVESEVISPKPAVNFLDVYEAYNLMAEGRFEVAGVAVVPANPRRVTLPPGQTIMLKWLVNTPQSGTFPGKIWLLLRFLPLDGSQPVEVPIFIHELDLRASNLFGLSGPLVRLLGSVGLVFGLTLSYDLLFGSIKRLTAKDTKDI